MPPDRAAGVDLGAVKRRIQATKPVGHPSRAVVETWPDRMDPEAAVASLITLVLIVESANKSPAEVDQTPADPAARPGGDVDVRDGPRED